MPHTLEVNISPVTFQVKSVPENRKPVSLIWTRWSGSVPGDQSQYPVIRLSTVNSESHGLCAPAWPWTAQRTQGHWSHVLAPKFSLGLTVKKLSNQFNCEILFKKTGPDSSKLSLILQSKKKKKKMNDKCLLCSIGNYVQYPVIKRMEKNIKKKCAHMHNWTALPYSGMDTVF